MLPATLAAVNLRPLRGALASALAASCLAAPLGAQTVSNPDLFRKSFDAAQEALRHYGVWDQPQELRRVAEIGYRIAAASGFTKFPFTYFLVDMPEPNAFALPGGQVFVTRGMLELGLSDDMLACLLGHEVAHVVYAHGLKMEKRATLLNVLSQAAVIGVLISADRSSRDDRSPIYDPLSRDDRTGDLVQGTAAAGLVLSELLLRSYNREFEDQADEEGQRWAAAAGFDPDGTRQLFSLMSSRLPQDKKYGYWQTHPFFDTREQAAGARGGLLKRQEARPADAFRERTQDALLAWLASAPPEKRPEPPPTAGPPPGRGPDAGAAPALARRSELDRPTLLKQAALAAWPQGRTAEGLRLERLHALRDRETARPPLDRDYGRLLAAYAQQTDEVRTVTPQSPMVQALDKEAAELRAQSQAIYPEAREVLRSGVYQTEFLAAFLSNYPEAPEAADAALSLGDAYSRLGRPGQAVELYLRAAQPGVASPAAQRARQGLRVLAPRLDDLAALQQLADQQDDAELAQLAATRLSDRVASFGDLASGAEYLRRYAGRPHATKVVERVNLLAQNLYGEMVLYQSVGDHVKALDRIQKILTYAPLSPAAERLRDNAVVQG